MFPGYLDVLTKSWWLLAQGAAWTIALSLATIAVSSLIGAIAAVAAVFGGAIIRRIIDAYLYLIRGVPLLLLLFFMYYGLPYSGIDIAPLPGGILVMSIYFGAFLCEVFRAGITALPRSQWDAARSLGMRLPLLLAIVVLPQAIRLSAPPFINTCVLIIKSTSLVSIIGLWELTLAGRQIVERTLAPLQILGGVAAIYFLMCFSLSRLGKYIEKRMGYAF
jgi:His/Glu/Gln/Arg/opine family amino acid ABC transporter permease subunit